MRDFARHGSVSRYFSQNRGVSFVFLLYFGQDFEMFLYNPFVFWINLKREALRCQMYDDMIRFIGCDRLYAGRGRRMFPVVENSRVESSRE